MKSYGIEFEKGTSIENANIEYAVKFPEKGSETSGQLFFRTDENKLYIRNADNNAWLSLTPSAVRISISPFGTTHGFSNDDIGTPIYFRTDGTWHKAIADDMAHVPTAVISHVIDDTHFLTQQSGTVNGIKPKVNADGGGFIPGKYYYVSTTVEGKYTATPPAKDKIKSLSLLAVASDVALLLNYAPQKPMFMKDLADFDVPPTAKPTNGQIIKYNKNSVSGNGGWEFDDPAKISVGTIHLPNGTAGDPTGISTEWANLVATGTQPKDSIIIATYAGSPYVKMHDGTTDGDWTPLGSATVWANQPDADAGIINNKGITPVTLKGVTDKLLALSGGTLTGPLTLTADPTNLMEPATKRYVDSFENYINDKVDTYVNDFTQDIDKIFDEGINALINTKPANGQTLVYDDTTDPTKPVWKPGKAGVDTLAALTDTNFGTQINDGELLRRESGVWQSDMLFIKPVTLTNKPGQIGIGNAWKSFGLAPPGGKFTFILANYNNGIYIKSPDKTGVNDADWDHLGDYLSASGGTLTGPLTLAADPANPMESVTRQYLEAVEKPISDKLNTYAKLIIDMCDPTTGYVDKTDSIGVLGDVDTTTFIPNNGQTLVYDSTGGILGDPIWKPGAGVAWATPLEVTTGTEAAKGITPATLTGHTVVAGPAAAGNSGKLVGLDSNGKIAAALLPTLGTTLQGAHDFTIGAPASPASGNIWFNNKTGNTAVTIKTVASPGGNEAITSGDMVLYDGTNYHIIPREEDLSDFVSKTRNNSIGAGMTMTWAASTSKTTVLDGSDNTKSQIANFDLTDCTFDGGVF